MEQDKELKLAEKKRLQTYLKQFWVKPLTDKTLLKLANIFQEKELYAFSVYTPSEDLLKSFAQRVILSFNKPLFWQNIEAYSLVEDYLAGESTVAAHCDCELLIIDYGVNLTPNKMLMPLVNGLIASRAQKQQYTLVLCHRQNNELLPAPMTISTSGSVKRDIV